MLGLRLTEPSSFKEESKASNHQIDSQKQNQEVDKRKNSRKYKMKCSKQTGADGSEYYGELNQKD